MASKSREQLIPRALRGVPGTPSEADGSWSAYRECTRPANPFTTRRMSQKYNAPEPSLSRLNLALPAVNV